jgi:hypothetical protein
LATTVPNLEGGIVAHEFLSEPWFVAVEALGPPPAGVGLDPGPINVVVARDGGDPVELHIAGGAMARGLFEGAPTTINAPYEVVRSIFVKRDQQAAMQAFMSGQVKVTGDMSKLMMNPPPTPEQEAFAKLVYDLTEL